MTIGFRCMAFSALLLLFFASPTHAQSLFAEPNNDYQHSRPLSRALKQWEVYRVDAPALSSGVKNRTNPEITLGNHIWRLELSSSRIISPDYTLQIITPSGTEIQRIPEEIAFQGYETNNGGKVRLTLTEDFIYGYISEGNKTWYVEPLWYYEPGAAPDLFVVYENSDVIPNTDATCAVREMAEKSEHYQQEQDPESTPETISACYQLDLAIASDRSMYNKYGSSVTNVQNHNIGVINNVEGDYTGEFNHDIQFNIVTQVVITGTDPWSNETDAGDLLDEFRDWGNSGGFGMQFDLGEMWTNRDFDGATVGVAWLNAVCTSLRYHLLQDFTSNAQQLRCMTTHEIGHNFSCNHDPETGSSCPPNFIMCPFVSTSSTWSTTSRNSVNSYLVGLINNGCLSACGGGGTPPTANFNWSPNPACQSQTVQFTDMSTGSITGRSWTFTGGTPTSSTQINPTAIWNTAGTFNVTLTATGPGGSNAVTKQVVIAPKPTADFTFSVSGNTVSFTNTSINANTYLWSFGNGSTSTDVDPVFTYLASGLYTVTLTATNSCGSGTKIMALRTAPTANFIASTQGGCAPLTVQFINQSTGANITTYNWLFQNGTPASSALISPSVVYNTPGTFDVSLTVTNISGSSTLLQEDFIVVQASPIAGFEWAANNLNVQFTNTSTNATGYNWDFGDGNFSTAENPNHSYTSGGSYTVILTVSNNCGVRTFTRLVQLEDSPVPGFSASVTNGCGPLTVSFINESSENTDSFQWLFPGGTPASSSAANPTVVYNNPGTYSVSLTAINALGSNTLTEQNYITVNAPPTPAFNSSSSGLTAAFSNTSVNAVSYLWNFGDGSNTSTATNPSHNYAADGVYTVTLTATNACGTSTSTQTVSITTPPTADFAANQTAGCAPFSVTFANESSSNATSFQWQFPGGSPATSTQANPVVVYATPGTYSATLIAVNAAGADTSVQNNIIAVNGGPTAAFGANVAGASASFSNTSINAVSYIWNFGDDSNTSTATNPGHNYAADGVYTVTLTATNACGTSTSTQTVTIITPPTADFSANQTAGCAPFSVTFANESSSNATSFQWLFPGGSPVTSTQANPVVVYTTPGTYSATLIAVNAAGADTSVQNNIIAVNGGPTAAFGANVAGASATFTNTSVNAVSYLWNFGDGSNTSTAVNPGHNYAADGVYTVTLTATNACGTSTSTQTISITTPPTADFSANQTAGCAPFSVTFANESSSNATSFQWQFPGGSPATSTQANPVVVYATPGTYSATLIAVNAAGADTSVQNNIIAVNGGPTAAFGANVAGASATFSNTSVNAVSYLWNFGDGSNTSTAVNPGHNYVADGVYTVTLTATNACGTSTSTQTVSITTPPTADFAANQTAGCGPLTVPFTNLSSSNATSFQWQFPGGDPSTSTAANPVVTYTTPGIYSVTLNAFNSAGNDVFQQTNFITVLPLPIASFTAIMDGLQVSFIKSSENSDSFFWNFGDPDGAGNNTSTEANPTHTYIRDGEYMVTLTVSNNCGAASYSQIITIVTPPNALFSVIEDNVCAPASIQFQNASSENSSSFQWAFEGGQPATSTLPNPVIAWSQPGIYTVTLTASNTAGSHTSTGTVTITGPPEAGFSSVTAGISIVTDNTTTGATSYTWNFGDPASGAANTSTLEAPVHTFGSVGTYLVTLIAANTCGADTFTTQVVIAGDAPQSAFSTGDGTAFCAPAVVQYNDLSAGDPGTWLWEFPGGAPASSTEQSPVVTYSQPGIYSATLTSGNIYGTNTATIENAVSIGSAPTSYFEVNTNGSEVFLDNLSTDADTYFWYLGDGDTSTLQYPNHMYAQSDTYNIVLIAANECGTDTFALTVFLAVTGAPEADAWNVFRLFPNPNAGQFTLEMSGIPQDRLEFVLFNTLGQQLVLETADFSSGTLQYNFDYRYLPAAMYTLRVRSGNQSRFVKIAIQK